MIIRQTSRKQGMASSDERLGPADGLGEFAVPRLGCLLVETWNRYLDLLINHHIPPLAPLCASPLGCMGPRTTNKAPLGPRCPPLGSDSAKETVVTMGQAPVWLGSGHTFFPCSPHLW